MQARGPSSRYCALWARLRSSRLPEVRGFQVRAPNPGSREPIQTLLPDYFCGRGLTPTSGLCWKIQQQSEVLSVDRVQDHL